MTCSHRSPITRERLRLSIVGDPERNIASIAERLDRYAGWLTSGALVVRFEDLVGPDGGGEAESQREAVARLYDYVGLGQDRATDRFRLRAPVLLRQPDLP